MKSAAAWLASTPAATRAEFLGALADHQIAALPWLFEFWALPHQLPPSGDWRTWVIMGGRGAGKTRAGAEWVRSMVEGPRPDTPGRAKRVGLIAQTMDQAREVMVFGDSGLMACCPPARRPEWIAGRAMLRWPNGAEARLFSAHDPEALRGPQFDAIWADEVAKWRLAQEAWDMLVMGLRLGDDPRACLTTTPRGGPFLRKLLAQSGTVMTHAPTRANRANLAPGFVAAVEAMFEGSHLGRQELDGLLVDEAEGTLWPQHLLDAALQRQAPPLDRIVVAVDPPVTGHAGSDACGIIVAGVEQRGAPTDWRLWVIEDATVQGASPHTWASAAIAAFHRHGADRLVAEVNQGGALVESVLRQLDPHIPYRAVRASKSKGARAEPVSTIYERGRACHLPGLALLEAQMSLMTLQGFTGKGSPDRVDALVWAAHELMLGAGGASPQIRAIG
ncbi:DNA-packaging protein [Ketogulonicigenium vulgare]|uniref:DNA-packaging protein n=1 Tax=Ketogulonicigenium vulgare TaxID=92945 RepID=UPI00067422BA|nr:terminase family protein [Ketogulonicigenium vulgare]ALJ80673.1 ATP-binding protein [Ketogulonicigenium vulgare]ANW33482.1 ATP-binding protein [Ketogulonicigenium vulgare]